MRCAILCVCIFKKGYYALIAVEMPKPNAHAARGELATCWGTICNWALLAPANGVSAVFLGSKGGYRNRSYVYIKLRVGALRRLYHQACAPDAEVANGSQHPFIILLYITLPGEPEAVPANVGKTKYTWKNTRYPSRGA